MNKTDSPKDFKEFVSLFPEVELPVTLSSEYTGIFSKYNKPIPEILIKKYISGEDIYIPEDIDSSYTPAHLKESKPDLQQVHLTLPGSKNEPGKEESGENDETETEVEEEIIACFRLPQTSRFIGLVYLKIGILTYEYYLHTYDKSGKTISTQKIAGLTVENDKIKEYVALIDEDLIILVMEGDKDLQDEYNPEKSHFLSFEIDDDGNIKKYKL